MDMRMRVIVPMRMVVSLRVVVRMSVLMRSRGGGGLRVGRLPRLVGCVSGVVDFSEGHAVCRGDPGTIIVFGAEGRGPVLEPAELAPDRAERRLDLGALPLQLVPADRVAA